MRKSVFLTLLVLMINPCLTQAQKKELSQARTILKSGKNVEQAEKLMLDLLKDASNKENKRIYSVWYKSVQMQYEAANEKLYLKQKQDTAQFFGLVQRMFRICETLDSLDMQPDRKGRVELAYRSRYSGELSGYRANLFYGGTYHLRKQQYEEAFDFFEMYIDCAHQPLFVDYDFYTNDDKLPEAAYWATVCGFRMKDPVRTLRYRELALRDSSRQDYTLQFVAEAWHWLKDDSLYHATLVEGFRNNPRYYYFFPRLVDYYNARGQYEDALAVCEKALEVNDTSELYLYAKSNSLLSLKRYDESIEVSEQLIRQNGRLANAYYNAGTAYLNLALKFDSRKEKKKVRLLYQKAQAYMEQYRKLAPKEQGKWGPALYRIYLNLNMGRQFDEIDRLLKK